MAADKNTMKKQHLYTSSSDSIDYVELYNAKPVLLHGYLLPFGVLYAIWAYCWLVVYGIENYFEVGLIILAAIGCLQVLACLCCHWSIHIKASFTCFKSYNIFATSIVKVVPTANNGYSDIVLLNKEEGLDGTEFSFVFQKSKYKFDLSEKKQVVAVTFPVDHSFKHYNEWKGYEDDAQFQAAKEKYGYNDMTMDIPKFGDLFRERATAPFFVFQVFCVGLWCLDEYWYYSVFTLFMLVVFECTLVQQQLRNMSEIRKMGVKPYSIQVYRNKKWSHCMTNELVSGDIISIVRSTDDRLIPCDVLLLRGPCIVDESMLTGESVPVMKEAVESINELDDHFCLETDTKLHVLSGGTKVVQHSPPPKTGPGLKSPDNGCIAYVLSTGFNTSQGRLLKTILYGVKQVTANNLETFMFILFLLMFALAASGYLWIEGTKDPKRNRYKLFLECTLIITSVVPPELPIELSLAVNNSLIALTKLVIFCTEPFRIPFAGKVDICCFDKTGTLTRDEMVVDGIAGLTSHSEDSDISLTSVTECPASTQQVLASCHSLVLLERDSELVGDPLEKAILSSVEWTLTRGEAVIPRKGSGKDLHPLKIFHRFHFSSALQRMSAVVGYTRAGSVDTEYMSVVKGSPEALKSMFQNVPEHYDKIYLSLARRGSRVLALGHRSLGSLSHQQVRDLKRENVEHSLEFAGFVSISCPLKQDSKAAVKEIRRSSHHITMITGDNPLTACHVARMLKMMKRSKTLILEKSPDDSKMWQWKATDDSLVLPLDLSANAKTLRAHTSQYDLCVTGEALSYLKSVNQSFAQRLLPTIGVFARVAPKQKEMVITDLKKSGFVTLMCGDGTNDVGALKHAHVGVALLANAPESLPPPPAPAPPAQVTESEPATTGRKPPGRGRGRPQGPQAGSNIQDVNKRLSTMMQEMEAEEKAQVVRLGDASIAAPFTSKLSSVQCVCHIIKQGRCTLVTTLQMFKILALNALILAYSQSVLYLDGVKFSDGQATFQGLLLAGCFLFISRSKPLKVLSRRRPLPNIFNVYTLLTVVLQFSVHFASLVYLTKEAKARDPNRSADGFPDLEAEFKPDLLNSVVYLISMSMQLSTFAVNYKGHPFMESLTENKPLLYSLLGAGLTVSSLCAGAVPEFAAQFSIVDIPVDFRLVIMKVMAGDMLICFLLDRTCDWLFAKGSLRRLI